MHIPLSSEAVGKSLALCMSLTLTITNCQIHSRMNLPSQTSDVHVWPCYNIIAQQN